MASGGLFDDLLPDRPPVAGGGMFDDLLTDEPDAPPFDDSGMFAEGNPTSDRAGGEIQSRLRDVVRKGAGYVGDKLGAVRRATYDPLVRTTVRAAGIPTPDVVDPDTGRPRPVTAPELLEEAVFPARAPGGRATSKDYVRAAVEASGVSRIPGMPNPSTIVDTMPDFALRLLGGAPGALGDLDELVAQNPAFARKAKVGEDLARVGVRTGAGFVDPLSIASGGAVAKAVGGGVKALAAAGRADQALAATGVALGTAGALEAAAKAHESYVKGDIDAMLVDLAEAATAAGMGAVARKGYKDIAAARGQRRAAVDTGPGYVPGADDAARVASDVATRTGALADVAALDPLDAAGLTKPETAPARVGAASIGDERSLSSRVSDLDRDLTSVRIEDAAPGRARTDSGLVERQGPVGRTAVRDEGSPGVRMSPRALAVARELGASAEPIPTTRPSSTRAAIQAKLTERIAARRADAVRAVANQDTAARQRAAVAEAEAGIGPDRDSRRRVSERATTLADAYTHLERLPGVGKELADRHRAHALTQETVTAPDRAAHREALTALGPNDKARGAAYSPVAAALEGKVATSALTPEQQATVTADRSILNRAFDLLNDARIDAGLPTLKREANYFPRVAADANLLAIDEAASALSQKKGITFDAAMEELNGVDPILASRSDRKGAFERERTGDLANARTDPGVIDEYLAVVARRVAELRHFGPNASKINSLLAQLPADVASLQPGRLGRMLLGPDPVRLGDREFAQNFFDRTRNVAPKSNADRAGTMIRTLSGLHDLVYAAVKQPLSIAQTAMAGGTRGTARGVLKTVASEVRAADLVRPRQLAHAVLRSVRQAGLDSERVAATSHHVTADLMSASMAADARPPFWIRAMLAADRGQRYVAVQTWRAVGPDLVAKAKAGNAAEQRSLDRLGIDWKSLDPTNAAAMDSAAKSFSDATQYRASIGTLPPWASSPGGRMAFQYLSFINAHTKTMKYVAAETFKGNFKPAARFLAVGLPIATASNELLDFLKGYKYHDKPVTSENFDKLLVDALKGKVSVNPTAGGREALIAVARGISALGVGMVYEAMLGRVGTGDASSLIPAGKYAKGALDVIGGKDEESRSRSATKLAASLIPPLPSTDLLRELAAGKKSLRPGWGGRLRDVVEDRLGMSGDEAGSAGRQRLIASADVAARGTAARKSLTDVAAPRPPKPAARRLTDAEKSTRKAELVLAMAKAIQSNDGPGRLAAMVEARRLRRPFTRKEIASLRGRVYRPSDDDADPEE